jgi:hypothetical protein
MSYLITVDLRNTIKVWSVSLNSEVGVIRELEELINFEIQRVAEWRLVSDEKLFFIMGHTNYIKVYNAAQLSLATQIYSHEVVQLTYWERR